MTARAGRTPASAVVAAIVAAAASSSVDAADVAQRREQRAERKRQEWHDFLIDNITREPTDQPEPEETKQ